MLFNLFRKKFLENKYLIAGLTCFISEILSSAQQCGYNYSHGRCFKQRVPDAWYNTTTFWDVYLKQVQEGASSIHMHTGKLRFIKILYLICINMIGWENASRNSQSCGIKLDPKGFQSEEIKFELLKWHTIHLKCQTSSLFHKYFL